MTPHTTSRALRLRTLEDLLAEQPRSASDLAQLLGVTERTIKRDLDDLAKLGHTLERRGRRYHLAPASTTLNPVEALAVHAATRLLVHHTRVNKPHYRSALTKLSRELPLPARRYLEASVADSETFSSERSRTLERVARAWFEGRLLAFNYTAPIGSGAPHRNVLEVYFFEISPMNLAPYVMGCKRSYFRAQRTFRLDRMDHSRLLAETYTVPDDFDGRAARGARPRRRPSGAARPEPPAPQAARRGHERAGRRDRHHHLRPGQARPPGRRPPLAHAVGHRREVPSLRSCRSTSPTVSRASRPTW